MNRPSACETEQLKARLLICYRTLELSKRLDRRMSRPQFSESREELAIQIERLETKIEALERQDE